MTTKWKVGDRVRLKPQRVSDIRWRGTGTVESVDAHGGVVFRKDGYAPDDCCGTGEVWTGR